MTVSVKSETSKNVHKNYKIFNTSIYFTDITKVFKQSVIHYSSKSQYSMGSSLILDIYVGLK